MCFIFCSKYTVWKIYVVHDHEAVNALCMLVTKERIVFILSKEYVGL